MTSAFFAKAEEEVHVVNELIFEPIWFGVITVAIFLAMLAFLWSFRNTLALDPHTHDDDDDHTPGGGSASADGRPSSQH